MKKHLFKVGDRITFKPLPHQARGIPETFKVVAALPPSNGSYQYRVRSEKETHDRMIAEDDLARVTSG